jgi:hypothetical protein
MAFRMNTLAYAPLILMAATATAHAAIPKGLEGRWIVTQLGTTQNLHNAQLPYELDFHTESDPSEFPDDARFNVVRVVIRAWAGSGCGFEVRGSTLVGTKALEQQSEKPSILCTSVMDGGGIEWNDLCQQKADPKNCFEASRTESQLLEAVLLHGDNLEWRRVKNRLIIYSPTADAELVLIPNPLR